jgi:hypothetical protein
MSEGEAVAMMACGDPPPTVPGSEWDARPRAALWGDTTPEGPLLFRGAGASPCHTFRHALATHLLKDRYEVRTIQEPLGHQDVRTPMISTHVLNCGRGTVRGAADTMQRPLPGPSLVPRNHGALDCGVPQPSAPASGLT